jgi:enamine deaminase RidA (YjgF/YER057c/UK114 family)
MPAGAEARLQNLGIELPDPPTPGGNYVPAKTVAPVVYLAGAISSDAAGLITGMVGVDRTIEDGYAAARACGLTLLAVSRRHLGSLDKVRSILSVNGYVNAVAGFPDSADAGRHVRAAIGVSALPRNALVEVQMAVEV